MVMGFLCKQMCVSQHLLCYLGFFLWHFSYLLACFVCFCSLSHFILLSLDTCLFSNEKKKENACFGVNGKWRGSGRNWGRGNHDQTIEHEKNPFSIKRERRSPALLILPHSLQAISMGGGFFFFTYAWKKNKAHLSILPQFKKTLMEITHCSFYHCMVFHWLDEAQLYILPPTDRHPARFQASSSEDAAAAGSCAGVPFHTSQSGSWRNSLESPAASKDSSFSTLERR